MKTLRHLLVAALLSAPGFAMAQTNNVALNKTATADPNEGAPQLAVDGSTATRWESGHGQDDKKFTVDLGKVFTDIESVEIVWEGAWGKSFDILISDDGDTFVTAKSIVDQNLSEVTFPYEQKIEFDTPVSARYVRFAGVARGTNYGYSFWEFRVMSSMFDPEVDLALGKPATAALNPENAGLSNDADINTRWGSSAVGKDDYDNQWWQVDLQAAYKVNKIAIWWEGAYSTAFTLEGRVSEDVPWSLLSTQSGEQVIGNDLTTAGNTYEFAATPARYIRIKSSENALDNLYGMSFWSFKVYATGKANSAIPVDGIALSVNTLALKVGDTEQLTATLTPEGAKADITWTSDAPEVATVDENGLVTAVAEGTANIKASVGSIEAVCVVTVAKTGAVASIEVSEVANNKVYDLNGRLVRNARPGQLVIVGNRLKVVK